MDVAVTEGKNRGMVIRGVPATAWNVHPRQRHAGAAGSAAGVLGGTTVEVCLDGGDMWVPHATDDPNSRAVVAAASPSQLRRTFASGDHVIIFANGHSDDHGVVVGPSRRQTAAQLLLQQQQQQQQSQSQSQSDGNTAVAGQQQAAPGAAPPSNNNAGFIDVMVGDIDPLVSFAGFTGRKPGIPARQVRSVPRSSLFHGRPRFGNGLVVAFREGVGPRGGGHYHRGSPRGSSSSSSSSGRTSPRLAASPSSPSLSPRQQAQQQNAAGSALARRVGADGAGGGLPELFVVDHVYVCCCLSYSFHHSLASHSLTYSLARMVRVS